LILKTELIGKSQQEPPNQEDKKNEDWDAVSFVPENRKHK
jgi:hypothetical protein